MSSSEQRSPATVEGLRLGAGFAASERDEVVGWLSKLDRRLRRFDADGVDLELSVKGRDTTQQQVVLEAWIAGHERFVATSREAVLKDAVREARDELWRQIDHAVGKRRDARRRG